MKKIILSCMILGLYWSSIFSLIRHQSFKEMITYEEQRNRNPIQLCHNIISDIPECNFFCSNGNSITKDDFLQHTFLKKTPLLDVDEIFFLVRKITGVYQKHLLSKDALWVDEQVNDNIIQTLAQGFYAQAFTVHNKSTIIVMGDYHGCAHSLARNILSLLKDGVIDEEGILRPNHFLIFLGDLADRGFYGIECWALAILLKLKNPTNVIILQGNHECDKIYKTGGLAAEFEYKYPNSPSYIDASATIRFGFAFFFSLLPQMCFIGTKSNDQAPYSFVQYCHGGIHTFATPQAQEMFQDLAGFETQAEFEQLMSEYLDVENLLLEALCTHPAQSSYLLIPKGPRLSGCTWNGFYANINGTIYGKCKGSRGIDVLIHGREVLSYLEKISIPGLYHIQGIVRGHDHMMNPIAWLHPFLSNTYRCALQQSWKPIVYDPLKPDELEDARNARLLLFTDEEHGYPVCTITSLASLQKNDTYGIVTFDPLSQAWLLTPHIRRTPFCAQELTSRAYWSYSEVCGPRDHELINLHVINPPAQETQ